MDNAEPWSYVYYLGISYGKAYRNSVFNAADVGGQSEIARRIHVAGVLVEASREVLVPALSGPWRRQAAKLSTASISLSKNQTK